MRWASPSSTRSMPRKRTDTLHAGFAARLRDLSVLGPLVKYSAPSTHVAPPPVGPHSRHEERQVGLRRVVGEDVVWSAPRQLRGPVSIEVAGRDRLGHGV